MDQGQEECGDQFHDRFRQGRDGRIMQGGGVWIIRGERGLATGLAVGVEDGHEGLILQVRNTQGGIDRNLETQTGVGAADQRGNLDNHLVIASLIALHDHAADDFHRAADEPGAGVGMILKAQVGGCAYPIIHHRDGIKQRIARRDQIIVDGIAKQ